MPREVYGLPWHAALVLCWLLLTNISSAELTEWMAYYQLEPFGESWFQTGTIAAAVANAAMFREGDPFVPADFMPTDPEGATDTEEAAKRLIVSRMRKELLKGH